MLKRLLIMAIMFSALPVFAQRERPQGKLMSDAQQGHVEKLKGDLLSIQEASQVTPAQKEALKSDLMAMVDGAVKPDPALVQKLADDLADALSDGEISSREMAKLVGDLEAVMNGANVSMSEVDKAISDVKAILLSSGVSQADVQQIVRDLEAIAEEAQKNVKGASEAAESKPQGERKKPTRRR